MTVKYKASFKKDTRDYDGLDHEPNRKAIISNQLQRVYAVVALDVAKVETITEQGGVVVPQMKIVHIEPQDGDNLIVVREMLDASYRQRTGQNVQASLFDQDDPQANADAAEHNPQAVGALLDGALPFVEPPAPTDGDQTPDVTTDTPSGPPVDPDDKPKGRGRR